MLQVYEKAKPECHYTASRFRNMLIDHDGLHAAEALLKSSGYAEGLTRLGEQKRLDISMEASALQDPWKVLFTAVELATARQKLKELGYQFNAG